MVDGIQNVLLGCPAIQSLNVLHYLHEVHKADTPNLTAPTEYSSLLEGNLGQMKTEYSISLHPDVKPFAISYP